MDRSMDQTMNFQPPTAVTAPGTGRVEQGDPVQTADDGAHPLDQELVLRVQQGDQAAFTLLVRRYQHRIAGLIGRYIADWSECQDVAQETFLRAYRAIGSFRGDSQFYTWLHRIAVNTAKNHLVAMRRRPPGEDIDVADAEQFDASGRLHDAGTPEHELLRHEIELAVQRAVEALPTELREAINLREVEGMSYEDIAARMGCPIGTVRSRIFRAREAIDAVLAPLLEQTSPGQTSAGQASAGQATSGRASPSRGRSAP
jgi:RNA polymerase sigma-70 factor (ECF subfamily)